MNDKTAHGRREISNHLLGSMEIALFMPSGAQRFSDSKDALKKSFLIPLVLLPMTLVTVLYAHPVGTLEATTANILMLVYSLRLVVYLAAFLGIVYMMAKGMDRLEEFNRFATANNWIALPAAALMLPLLLMFLNGNHVWADIYPMMVIITLYSYAYTAFMVTYVLRVPWEMAAFVAVIGLAVHQSSLDIIKWAAVQTIYLVT